MAIAATTIAESSKGLWYHGTRLISRNWILILICHMSLKRHWIHICCWACSMWDSLAKSSALISATKHGSMHVFTEVTNSSYFIDKPPRITIMCSESKTIHLMKTRELTRALIWSRYSETSVDPLERVNKSLDLKKIFWNWCGSFGVIVKLVLQLLFSSASTNGKVDLEFLLHLPRAFAFHHLCEDRFTHRHHKPREQSWSCCSHSRNSSTTRSWSASSGEA